MATTTAVSSHVSIEEYLGKSYRPDVEFIDGELKERPDVPYVHGRLRALICGWFGEFENEWAVIGASGVRTKVSSTRVRLPDVIINHAGQKPATFTDPPLIVIEILSPGDTYAETQRLAQDYEQMGVQNIWLIDPETRTGRICQANSWIAVNASRLRAPRSTWTWTISSPVSTRFSLHGR